MWTSKLEILIRRAGKKIEIAKDANKLPKVLIVVHFSGRPADMLRISSICKKNNIKIIEDAAHSLGATQYKKLIGNCEFSEITVFSLHPAKIITSAEGGLVTSQNLKIIEKMKKLSHGRTVLDLDEPWKYDMQELGFNYRMSDLMPLRSIPVKRLNNFLKIRREIVLYYMDALKNLPLRMPPSRLRWHLFVCQTEDTHTRTELFKFLNKKKINAGIHYRPIYQNSYFQKNGFNGTFLPNAEKYYSSSLSLPLYADITNIELNYIISKLHEFYGVKYA